MKKFYLLLVSLFALSAQAAEANLTFFVGDKEVTPGSTVYFADYQAEEYEPGVWDLFMNPHVSLHSDFFTNTVKVTAECTSKHNVQMCTGGCIRANKDNNYTVVKDGLIIGSNAKLDLEFEYIEGEYEGETVPDVTTVFTAQDGNGTPISFTLVMGPSANASVETVTINNTVTPVENGIAYSLSTPSTLALYNLAGVKVLNTKLSGNGVISTTNLSTGIYIYSLDGKKGKIIVK